MRTTRPGRPFGVTAIVILLVASAVVSVGSGLLTLQSIMSGSPVSVEALPQPAIVLFGALALTVLEGAADMVAAIGLLKLRRWAWVLVMLLVGYGMADNLWRYFSGGGAAYTEMLLDVVIVFYLNQRDVQRAFGHGDERTRRLDIPVQQAP